MKPITRDEMYLATAAGEYSGELPEPITRQEQYLKKIIDQIDGGGSVSPEEIDAAIEDYLNSHDAGIVTEQELSDALAGYYNKTDIDNALDSKADSTDIPDVSDFVTTAALNEKQDALTAGDNISIETINGELTISATDTTYSDATQQTHGLMSTADKTKLDSITAAKIQAWDAAEQNVNADWTAESGDAQILHKPDLSVYALAANVTKSALGIDNVDNTSDADKPISTAAETALAGKVDKETGKSLMTADEHTKLDGIETGAQVNAVTGVKGNAENNYRTGEINISPANIGLGNVDNTSDANKPISTATQTALDGKQNVLTFDNAPAANSENPVKSSGVYSALAGKISTSAKGAAGGVAELDANGKVPSSQLPSYVDNVVEYPTLSDFPATGESGKIYIALNTNLTYRWGGSDYAEISPSIALGTTDSTAYRGDWGAADRAAIGTLTDLQTTAKSDLVSAVNEVKTALGNVQGTLTFDNVPTASSENPVKSGGIYTALAGKQDTLTIDSAPTSGSDNPVKSGGVYTALSGKQDTLIFDSTPTQNSIKPVTSGGIYSALADKVDAEPNKGLISDSERTKLSGITAGATATSVTQTLSSGTKIGTITVDGVETDLYCEANTDTTYSAGTGISISNGEISNSAPNVQADWTATTGEAVILHKPTLGTAASKDVGTGSNQVAAGDHNHTGVYAPYSHSHSYAAVNHSHRTAFSITTGVNMVPAANRTLSLGDVDVSNYEAIEIRYLMYSYRAGSTDYNCYSTVRAMNTAGGYGNIPVIRFVYSSGTLKICVCRLTLSGSNLTLADAGGLSSDNNDTFYIGNVIGYK